MLASPKMPDDSLRADIEKFAKDCLNIAIWHSYLAGAAATDFVSGTSDDKREAVHKSKMAVVFEEVSRELTKILEKHKP